MAFFKSKLSYFFYGVGSLISIFPQAADSIPKSRLYKPARSVEEAFRADWYRLGNDMTKAVKTVIVDGQR
jgi:hypothetical protein